MPKTGARQTVVLELGESFAPLVALLAALSGPPSPESDEIGLTRSGSVAKTNGVHHPRLVLPPAEGPLSVAPIIDGWCSNLTGRNKRPRTVQSYRQFLTAAAKADGWATVADLSGANMIAYLDRMRLEKGWKSATYNRGLAAFASLSRYLRKTGHAVEGLQDPERAADDGDDGSRAATTEEARAIIREAWVRAQVDKRTKGNRALYWACLFLAGLRAGEPERWRWQDVYLDEDVPFVFWRKELQKNRRQVQIALAPELAELLRTHQSTVPNGASAPVFPVVPPRTTFRSDRDRAGIPVLDHLRRRFSCHSARKWFSTEATRCGVPEKMVDFLMRHRGRTEHRYYQPSLRDQQIALMMMPELWPEKLFSTGSAQSDKSGQKDLTEPERLAEDEGVQVEGDSMTFTHDHPEARPTPQGVRPEQSPGIARGRASGGREGGIQWQSETTANAAAGSSSPEPRSALNSRGTTDSTGNPERSPIPTTLKALSSSAGLVRGASSPTAGRSRPAGASSPATDFDPDDSTLNADERRAHLNPNDAGEPGTRPGQSEPADSQTHARAAHAPVRFGDAGTFSNDGAGRLGGSIPSDSAGVPNDIGEGFITRAGSNPERPHFTLPEGQENEHGPQGLLAVRLREAGPAGQDDTHQDVQPVHVAVPSVQGEASARLAAARALDTYTKLLIAAGIIGAILFSMQAAWPVERVLCLGPKVQIATGVGPF